MRGFQATAVAALLAVAAAVPAAKNTVIHEKRDQLPSQWVKRSRLSADFSLPVRIGLTQRNIAEGEMHLLDVSDPASKNYGKHWTPQQVHDFFTPSDATIDTVKEWLHNAGIDSSRLKHSPGYGWLEFDAPASEVESLLGTEYFLYDHASQDRSHVGCNEYHVPAHVASHIDLITPTLHFDAKPEKASNRQLKKRGVERRQIGNERKGQIGGGPKGGRIIDNITDVVEGLTTCDAVITPACLRALYKLPLGDTKMAVSTFGIVEYAPETYLQADLDEFWATPATNDASVPIGTAPKIVSIDGGFLEPITDASFGINGEPDLDLEYAMDLVYPQVVTLYQVGDDGKNAAEISFNNFLDALDASYCKYDGGDDPTIDETFPDPGGYAKKHNCGTTKPTAVISTSYAYNEHDLTQAYEARQCYEYMKLGLMGTSFLFSSGDYGVAGNSGQCINADGTYNNGTSGRFNPSFPSVCPYVTSVGATQIPVGGSVTTPETACETVIYSGGGFSDNFAIPSYQKTAVAKYFKSYKPTYTAAQYNNSQQARGLPDVSANGANYIVALDGTFELVYGTSASAPTFASVITLINEKRVAGGNSTLGFLNPTFYANPGIFNDIVNGTNMGCGTTGFSAVKGWDPVTGLGTPNYGKMVKLLG